MRRMIALALCALLLGVSALAESGLTMIVETEDSTVLIREDGTLLTQPGDYDVIYCFTYDACAPDRRMYAVATLDGESQYEEDMDGELDFDYEIDIWPYDDGQLPEEGDQAMDELEWALSQQEDMDDGGWDLQVGEELPEALAGEDWDEDWSEWEDDSVQPDSYYNTLFAAMNAQGQLITDFAYTSFVHDVENAVIFATRADGFVDALDESGNVLLSGNYAAMVSDGQGGYMATRPDLDKIDDYGDFPAISALVHVAHDGQETDTGCITGTYELSAFDSGYMCVPLYSAHAAEYPEDDGADAWEEDEYFDRYEGLDYDYESLGYVYLNIRGENAFGGTFPYATPFSGGYAEVEGDDYVARLINASGEYVTDKEYGSFDRSESTADMPIVANLLEGGFDLLNRGDLSVIASYTAEEYGEGLFASLAGGDFIMAYSESGTMIMDHAGRVIYATEGGDDGVYAYTWYAYCEGEPGRILLSRGEWPYSRCGLIDLEGNVVGDTYQELSALSWKDGQGRYLVASFDIEELEYDGEVIYDADYDSFFYGMIDQDGKVILDTKYTSINCIAIDRFWVSDGEVYQLMDENGNVLYQTY